MAKDNKKVVTEEIELAEETPTALAVPQEDLFSEFDGDQDKRGKDDILIERLRLVQGLTKGQAANKLSVGMIYATASKRGFEKLLVVPIKEDRVIIERKADEPEKGKFIAELQVNDPRVVAAVKKNNNNYVKLHSAEGTALVETRNVHVAFLDPEDGVTCTGFGILQAESTNIRPVLAWRDQRVGFKLANGKSATTLATYFFRTWVDGGGVHPKNETRMYRFTPYKNGSWKDSILNPSAAEELQLLRSLKAHKELLDGGQLDTKISNYSDADDSEAAQEEAAF
jgi:hypothetical protein